MNPTGETPFSIVYGTKAVIPAEVTFPSAWVQSYDPDHNDAQRRVELDLVEKRRERARVWIEAYRRRVQHAFNKRVVQ